MLELILEFLLIGEGLKIGDGKERHSEWERFIMSSGLCSMLDKNIRPKYPSSNNLTKLFNFAQALMV